MLPQNLETLSECIKSFKSVKSVIDDRSTRETSDYFLSMGLNELKTTMAKSFAKKINDFVV